VSEARASGGIERIAIVGAGLAGLALTLALRRRGLSPDVVERRAGWSSLGAGIYLVGNAVRALAELGVPDPLARGGAVIRTQRFMDHRGKQLFEVDVESFWRGCGPCVCVRRSDLVDLLLGASGAPPVRVATTVERLDPRDDEVSVGFSDGRDGGYDLVVGADGIRSSVRQLLFGARTPRYCGQVAWRFLAPCPDVTAWTVMLGRHGAFLVVPAGRGEAYCYCDASVPEPLDDPPGGRLERLRERFRDYADPARAVLSRLAPETDIHFATIEDVLQDPPGVGRVLLIGDAAHAASPNMASGAALAFEDALVLAELVSSRLDPGELAPEFARRRMPRVRWIQEQTRRRDRMRALPAPVRDVVLRSVGPRLYRSSYEPMLARL
jgi:2-polyprenyl-6-methoxyphenol hydroxylase-like FAD-dependent oxidoreductase